MPKQPPLTLDAESPAFSSADAAAHAYSHNIGTKGDAGEKAGVILKDPDGKYRYTTTVDGTNDSFELRAAIPKGFAFAGIMHSHPGDDARGQVFSPDDVRAATQAKVPSYISFLNSGEVRKFVPGQTKTQQMSDPTSRIPLTVARGDALDIEAGM